MRRQFLPAALAVLLVGCPEDRFDLDDDGTSDSLDCAPSNPDIHPGATEICGDGIDQDCDGSDAPCGDDDDSADDDDDSADDDDSTQPTKAPCTSLYFYDRDDVGQIPATTGNSWPEGNSSRTVMIWARVQEGPGNVWSFRRTDSTQEMALRFGDPATGQDTVILTGVTDGVTDFVSLGSWEPHRWVHYAITHTPGALTFYRNGTPLLSSSSVTLDTHADEALLLGSENSLDEHFRGEITDLRIWSRALTVEQVAAEMVSAAPETLGLVGHWPISDPDGTGLAEISGQAAPGTLSGPYWVTECPFADSDGDGEADWLDCAPASAEGSENNGSAESCPGRSCIDLLERHPELLTASYWIDPTGSGEGLELTCDMSSSGGGWTPLVDAYRQALVPNLERNFLFVSDSRWVASPRTTGNWSWEHDTELHVSGTWNGGDVGSASTELSHACTAAATSAPSGDFGVWCGTDDDNPFSFYFQGGHQAELGTSTVCGQWSNSQGLFGLLPTEVCTTDNAVQVYVRTSPTPSGR